MLSIFPDLLAYQMFAPLLLRLTLGAIFIYWSYKTIFRSTPNTQDKIISLVEGVAGILLIIGLWTQLASLFITIDLIVRLYKKFQNRALLSDGVNYYLILLVIALSLLFTGAGFLSIDLPL